MDMFEKWNYEYSGVKYEVKEVQENNRKTEYEKVPYGKYEVKLDKMELKPSKKGGPMVSAWFTIVEGKYKKSKLFMNQVVTRGFQIKIVNDLLRSMKTDIEIDFDNYNQYAEMLLDVAEFCDENKLEFELRYEDNNGFDKFTILDVFEG